MEGKCVQVPITIVTGFISEPLDRHKRSLVTKQTGVVGPILIDHGRYHLGRASVLIGAYSNSLYVYQLYVYLCRCVCLWHSVSNTLLHAGLLVTLLIIEFLGRKKTMAIEFIACMAGFLLLYICAVL